MVPWLILRDTRLSPEARCLYLLILRELHKRKMTVLSLDQDVLAGLLGKSERTVRALLPLMIYGDPKCQVPLLEAIGRANTQRRFRLRPLAVVYGNQLDQGFPVTLPEVATFKAIHGDWVAEQGFVPLPVAILGDPRLSPAARIAFAGLCGLIRQKGIGAPIKFFEVGEFLGTDKWERIQARIAEWDRSINPECSVPLVESALNESKIRVWRLLPNLEELYSAGKKWDSSAPKSCQQKKRDLDLPNQTASPLEDEAGSKWESSTPESCQLVPEMVAEDGSEAPPKPASGNLEPHPEVGSNRDMPTPKTCPPYIEERRSEDSPSPTPSTTAMPTAEQIRRREEVEWIVADSMVLKKMIGAGMIDRLVSEFGNDPKLPDAIDLVGHHLRRSAWTPNYPWGYLEKQVLLGGPAPAPDYVHWSKRMANKSKGAFDLNQPELPFPMPERFHRQVWNSLGERTREVLSSERPLIVERNPSECWLLANDAMENFIRDRFGAELGSAANSAGYQTFRIVTNGPQNRELCGLTP